MTDHVRRNRDIWNRWAADYVEAGKEAWASAEPYWGIWGIPERELRAVPDVAGKDTIELGCGTGYWSAWLARRGARAVGFDRSERQLATAGALQREHGLRFPLVHADGERPPFADASFDVAISEYGVCLWCDPYRWLPEAARLLRPGGELVFMTNATLLTLCMPSEGRAGDRLCRDQFGLHCLDWGSADDGVEFHLGHGDWIRLFGANGLAVEDLIEVRAPAGATSRYTFVDAEWARRWPTEEIWRLRRTGDGPAPGRGDPVSPTAHGVRS